MNSKSIYLLLFVFLLSGCTTQKALYKNPGYRDLLMYSGKPTEVFGHWNDGIFVQFQRFERAIKDTVVVVRFDEQGRFSFAEGIEIEGDFVRYKFMDILHINGDAFFVYNYSNQGNSNNNIVRMFYIAPDCSLHPVEVVRADSLYSSAQPDGRFVWDGENIDFSRYPISSRFYVWNKGESHAEPTAGHVDVVYEMEKIANGKYRFYPKEMDSSVGSYDLNELFR